MMYGYKAHSKYDLQLNVAQCCPHCNCHDLEVVCADYDSACLQCNSCKKCFSSHDGLPVPAVRETLKKIAELIAEANRLGGMCGGS